MKTVTYFLFIFFVSITSFAKRNIQSLDEITFHSAKEIPILGLGKVSEYLGVIERTVFNKPQLRTLDVYQFNNNAIKVTSELCQKTIESTFAISKLQFTEQKSLQMLTTKKGSVCAVVLGDKINPPKPKNILDQRPQFKFIFIGMHNSVLTEIVAHMESDPSLDHFDEMIRFWERLR